MYSGECAATHFSLLHACAPGFTLCSPHPALLSKTERVVLRLIACVWPTFSVLLCDCFFQHLVHFLKTRCARCSIQDSCAGIVSLPDPKTGLRVTGVDVVKCIQLWVRRGVDLLLQGCCQLCCICEGLSSKLCQTASPLQISQVAFWFLNRVMAGQHLATNTLRGTTCFCWSVGG